MIAQSMLQLLILKKNFEVLWEGSGVGVLDQRTPNGSWGCEKDFLKCAKNFLPYCNLLCTTNTY